MKFSSLLCIILVIFSVSCHEDDFLDGIDKQALFATPTQAEIDEVETRWHNRDLSVRDYNVERTVTLTDNGTILKLVSFRVSGFKEYGALVIPKSESAMPVRLFIGGFGIDVTENSVGLILNDNSFTNPFIFAVPALRGQSLSITINGVEYTTPVSEGEHCEAFDGGADDVLAFLNVIAQTESMSDVTRTAVRGGSRGATVAMLTGERDLRVKKVVAIAGPANLMSLTATSENDATYQCQFLDDLVHGNSTIHAARQTLIASSPVYFAKLLPDTEVHLAANDKIVPTAQGDELNTVVGASANPHTFALFIYAGRDHGNIGTDNTEMNDRIELFLSDL